MFKVRYLIHFIAILTKLFEKAILGSSMDGQGNSRHQAITGQGSMQLDGAGTPKEPQSGAMEPWAQGHGRCHPSIISCWTKHGACL